MAFKITLKITYLELNFVCNICNELLQVHIVCLLVVESVFDREIGEVDAAHVLLIWSHSSASILGSKRSISILRKSLQTSSSLLEFLPKPV